jgi:hypothetical protein
MNEMIVTIPQLINVNLTYMDSGLNTAVGGADDGQRVSKY